MKLKTLIKALDMIQRIEGDEIEVELVCKLHSGATRYATVLKVGAAPSHRHGKQTVQIRDH